MVRSGDRFGRTMSGRLKILVVEDDALIAMELEERLQELGYEVLGPVATVEEAERAIAETRPDAALLDANLAGVSSVPIGVQAGGHGRAAGVLHGLRPDQEPPPELANAPILTKPISDADLVAALKKLRRRLRAWRARPRR